jgi:sporulation integral membrane protein YtvI
MFDEMFKTKFIRFVIFIIIFTLFFIFFLKTISVTMPFIIAFIVALSTRPLMNFFRTKCKLSSGISALISTTMVLSLLVILLSILIFKITTESRQLLATIPNFDIQKEVGIYLDKIKVYFNHADPNLVQKAQEQISVLLSNTFNITADILNKLVSVAIGLPMFLLIVVVTLLATYFFTKDMPNVKNIIVSIFVDKHKEKVKDVISEATRMLAGYIKAYSFIITFSFIEILIGLTFFKVKYALILSLLCWVLELIPILGIFVVFFPLITIYFISGNYFVSIGLAVLWLIVVSVRQIIEPKIVSSSLGLHPLAVLAAIFIGLTTYGFTGMIYLLAAMVIYKILNKVGII